MNEKMLQILAKMNEKRAEAQNFLAQARKATGEEKKDFKAKARVATDEVKDLQEEFNIEKDLMESEKTNVNPVNNVLSTDKKAQYDKAFYNFLKGKMSHDDVVVLDQFNAALKSTVGEDGGYLIPEDEQVAIRELKRQFGSLEELVNVETVGTLTGSRVIEKDAAYTPFTEFIEGDDVPATDSPQFVTLTYSIKDRGGILPIPNNLLADNGANLKSYINRWLAKKQTATRNNLIVGLLKTLTPTAIASVDDVKDVFDVTLDPAISAMGYTVMNQDSFNVFNKLKDNDGNYLLEKDPKNPTQKLLDGKPVKVYSNKVLPTRTDAGTGAKYAPVIFGNLNEAITLFDRQAMSLMSTNVGGDAFAKNRTDIRAITREDIKFADTAAVVFGEVVL
jgi:HK97 family phage major capsid protein